MWYKGIAFFLASHIALHAAEMPNAYGIYEEAKEEKIVKTDSEQHIFKEDIYKTHNPLFTNARHGITLHYNATLGLSNSQTLLFQGANLSYMQPVTWKKLQLQFFGNTAFGNILLTADRTQREEFFYGLDIGFHASYPLDIQDIVSHFVFGADIGLGGITKQASILPFSTYYGMDFLYNNFIFRPFFDVALYLPFSSAYKTSLAELIGLGFKTFYRADSLLASLSLSFSYLISNNMSGIFILLPHNTKPLYLGKNMSCIDFVANIEYFTTQHISFQAMIMATHTLNHYAISASAHLGMRYRF